MNSTTGGPRFFGVFIGVIGCWHDCPSNIIPSKEVSTYMVTQIVDGAICRFCGAEKEHLDTYWSDVYAKRRSL